MAIKIYVDYLSQPSRAVWAVCLLGGFPFEVVEKRLAKGELYSEEYKKINPMSRVPALVDTENNLHLAESHAIIRYLCLKYPEKLEKWYPMNDSIKRAKIDEYLDFHHTNTRKCANLIFWTLFAPNLGLDTSKFDKEQAKKQAYRALRLFSKHYIGKTDYIGADVPSVADISAFYEIQFLMIVGEDFSEHPKINGWLSRVGQIPEVAKANASFLKLIAKRKQKAKL